MACRECDDKGFVESVILKSAKELTSIILCPKCKNISGYSNEVQRRHSNKPMTTSQPDQRGVVLRFPQRERLVSA